MCPKYRSKNIYSIHAVSNALEFLDALCEEGDSEGIRLSSLGKRLGLAKSSVYRLLMTFEDWGFSNANRSPDAFASVCQPTKWARKSCCVWGCGKKPAR